MARTMLERALACTPEPERTAPSWAERRAIALSARNPTLQRLRDAGSAIDSILHRNELSTNRNARRHLCYMVTKRFAEEIGVDRVALEPGSTLRDQPVIAIYTKRLIVQSPELGLPVDLGYHKITSHLTSFCLKCVQLARDIPFLCANQHPHAQPSGSMCLDQFKHPIRDSVHHREYLNLCDQLARWHRCYNPQSPYAHAELFGAFLVDGKRVGRDNLTICPNCRRVVLTNSIWKGGSYPSTVCNHCMPDSIAGECVECGRRFRKHDTRRVRCPECLAEAKYFEELRLNGLLNQEDV